MGMQIDVQRTYVINGIRYESLDDMPPHIRKFVDEKIGHGPKPDTDAEPIPATAKTRAGEYGGADPVPGKERALHKPATKAAGLERNRNAALVAAETTAVRTAPVSPESVFPAKWLIFAFSALFGVAAGLGLYFSQQ